MTSRLTTSWLNVAKAPDKFTVTVTYYGIEDGKYGESDFIAGDVESIPRKIKLNQTSLLYLAQHKHDPTEEGLTKSLPGCKLRFEKKKLGNFDALVVCGIIAKKEKKA